MKTMLALTILVGVLINAMGSAFAPPADPAPESGLKAALDAALADERHARAFYLAVMERHGERRPFSNIVHAEGRHEAALLAQYERLGLEAPADGWRDHAFSVPATFREACDVAIVSEVRNAGLYDDLIANVDDEAVRNVFDNLRRASLDRHLPAFRRHGSGWEPVAATALTPAQSVQRDTADAARQAMFGMLLRELMATMAEAGPPGAIEVCSDRAPAIAKEVAAEHGVRMGRTSWKLRNPANAPPVWADLLVDERPEEPRLVADRTGRLGVLTPIRLAATCTTCHGGPDDLAPGVREKLGQVYPDDRATGFETGDLRGWFWVEVPGASETGAPRGRGHGQGRGRGQGCGRGR